MTVVDTSVLVELVTVPEHQELLLKALRGAAPLKISAFSFYEACLVTQSRLGAAGAEAVKNLIKALHIDVVEFNSERAVRAAEVYSRFGRGFHGAKLNMGDCPVYDLARELGATLMFKGDDFSRTDLSLLARPI